MTSTFLITSSPLLGAVLHGAGLGGLFAAAVLTRARLRGWTIDEPWGATAWSLLGAFLVARSSRSSAGRGFPSSSRQPCWVTYSSMLRTRASCRAASSTAASSAAGSSPSSRTGALAASAAAISVRAFRSNASSALVFSRWACAPCLKTLLFPMGAGGAGRRFARLFGWRPGPGPFFFIGPPPRPCA